MHLDRFLRRSNTVRTFRHVLRTEMVTMTLLMNSRVRVFSVRFSSFPVCRLVECGLPAIITLFTGGHNIHGASHSSPQSALPVALHFVNDVATSVISHWFWSRVYLFSFYDGELICLFTH